LLDKKASIGQYYFVHILFSKMNKELIGPISREEELMYLISSEEEIMTFEDIKEFESQAAEYLQEKGIEYDSIPEEDHEARWVDVHGVKIPKAA